ncbi:MAG: hypothetical protein U0166_04885 [Acidobacteriota bacterium]
MPLTKDQKKFYENTVEVTKKEIEEIDQQIEEELARVKERLAELQNAKKSARQIYDGACDRLGVENELAKDEAAGGGENPGA